MTDYVRPSYLELFTRISADLAAMPAVLAGPLSAALARSHHGQHGYLEWIDRQCSPLTCELERLYDWAQLYGVPRLMARAASGQVRATGVNGTVVLAGTPLRGQNGLDYSVLDAVSIAAGSALLRVRCESAGIEGNTAAGSTLVLIDPIAGCANTMTADAGLTGGAADEEVDAWRIRVAEEWRVVTQIGARAGRPDDYKLWAKSAHPSVSGALVQPHALGTGTVLVRPICNALPNRAPTQAVLDAVASYFYSIAPATADWRVAVPLKHALTIQIHLYPTVDTAANRAAINAALQAACAAELDERAILSVAEINAAIATITSQYTLISPGIDTQAGTGEVLVLEVIWS